MNDIIEFESKYNNVIKFYFNPIRNVCKSISQVEFKKGIGLMILVYSLCNELELLPNRLNK